MLACYPPHFPPVLYGESPSDTGSEHILLYRKFWLITRWEGLRTMPRVVEATVSAYGRTIAVAPERLHVLTRREFDLWYRAHRQTFHTITD